MSSAAYTRRVVGVFLVLLAAACCAVPAWAQSTLPSWRFVFGSGPVAAGEVLVAPDTPYSAARGHGFEPVAPGEAPAVPATAPAVAGPRAGHAVLAPQRPVHFSVALPEGSWRITATLGGTAQASDTTLKAELRRLVLQGVATAAGRTVQASFTVHVRNPRIGAAPGRPAGEVALRVPRESVDEAWNWDDRLTLEINGTRPVLQALVIEPVQVPLVFLLGDSTVADQSREPYASWGQMLPRWLGPGAAVVSLAQSGETYRDSLQRRRLDKILALGRPGDTVLMQYGHNDQKQLRDGSGSVASYQDEIRRHVAAIRGAGLQPVLVTSVERRFFEPDGSLRATLADHVAAVRAVAAEQGVPVLDLNTASRSLYLALGPTQAQALFAIGPDGKVDPTHHNGTGAWVLAGLVAQGLRDLQLPVAAQLRPDAPRLRAEAPPALPAMTAALPPSPGRAQQPPAGDGAPQPTAVPASATAPASASAPATLQGFAPERLARLDAAIDEEIARGRLAGAATLLLRDGQVVHQRSHGWADVENRRPVREDTLFRIASMTKAVTTVAALMLYEEGHFLLRDPVSRWIPAFGRMRVAVPQGEGQPPRLEAPRNPVTVRDLLLHTAGLSYGAGPAAAAWRAAGYTDWYLVGNDETLAQWTERLAQLPLQAHPGETWQYGYATDVLGRLVELWSGMPLDRYIAERITGPLRMNDTRFFVSPADVPRLARVYGLEGGRLVLKETAETSDFVRGPRRLFSGGAGLVSTIGDYARFLQMLLNRGTLEGVRLLSPATVEMMQRDHVGGRIAGYGGDGEGAGFGFWLQHSPGTRSELGSVGAWGWGSAYSPQYVVDPRQRLVFVYMAQLRPSGDSTINQRAKVLMRQALVE